MRSKIETIFLLFVIFCASFVVAMTTLTMYQNYQDMETFIINMIVLYSVFACIVVLSLVKLSMRLGIGVAGAIFVNYYMVISMGIKKAIKQYSIKHRVKKSVKGVEKSRKKTIIARSKRVGVEFRIKSKRTISGKVFYAHDWEETRASAIKTAREIISAGDLSRIIILNRGYAIYIHSK